MRKIWMTALAAIGFVVAGMAQERDTTRNESYQYRPMIDTTEQAIDSAETDIDQESRELRRDMENEIDTVEQEIDSANMEFQRSVEEGRENLQQDVERTDDQIRQRAEETDEAIQQERTDDQKDESAEENKDERMNEAGDDDQVSLGPEGDVEVLESKEGPNNEVVYKYQGDLYYVDRESKEFVKVKRSELKDSKHKVIVKEGIESDDRKNRKKSKG